VTLSHYPWRIIRTTLLLCAASLLIALFVLSASFIYLDSQHKNYRSQTTTLLSLKKNIEKVERDTEILNRFLPQLEQLKRENLIGSGDRLSWIEALQEGARQLKLHELEYRIEEGKPYTPPDPLTMGDYQIFSSAMYLKMQLYHASDLITLLAALSNNAKGLLDVDRCTLRRLRSEQSLAKNASLIRSAVEPRINAECHLRWLTLKYDDTLMREPTL